MRNQYELKSNQPTRKRADVKAKKPIFSGKKLRVLVISGIFLCILITGTFLTWGFFTENKPTAQAPEQTPGKWVPDTQPPIPGDPIDDLDKKEDREEKEWWDTETNPHPIPEHSPVPSSSKTASGNTEQMIHNNWRNPNMSLQPEKPQTSNPKSRNHQEKNGSKGNKNSPSPVSRTLPSGKEESSDESLQVSVWYPSWERTQAARSLQNHTQLIDEVNLFAYDLQADGSIKSRTEEEVSNDEAVQIAQANGIRVLPTVGNQFSPSMLHEVLKDEEKRRLAMENILQLIHDNGYDGVEIHVQPIFDKDRDLFSLWVEELASKLHKQKLWLSISVYPKLQDPGSYPVQKAQDWKRLGKSVDSLKILAYNYSWGQPGPMTPLTWIDDILTFAKSQVPSHKIYLGLPWYGYYWDKDQNQFTLKHRTAQEIEEKTEKRDKNQEPYFIYQKNGEKVTGYYQDRISYEAKLKRIMKNHSEIAGISHWYLGSEDPGVWQVIQEEITSTGK